MSDELYLDLIECAMYDWIKLAFKIDASPAKNCAQREVNDKVCLLYTDVIDGKEKCCLLYVEPEYPPFDQAEIKVLSRVNFMKTKFLWKAIVSKVRHFICSIVKTMEEDNIEFFNNVGIADELMCMNISFYPLKKDLMMDAFKDRYPNSIAIEETKKTGKDLFQWYVKKIPRLAIKVEVLDDLPPPITHTDLLANFLLEPQDLNRTV